MPTVRSILSFIAMRMAVECSAALPTIANTMTPTSLGQADAVPTFSIRADKKLREQCDHGRRDEQDSNGFAARPLLAAFIGMCVSILEEMLVGPGARN